MCAIDRLVSAASTELGLTFYTIANDGFRQETFCASFRNTDVLLAISQDRLIQSADWFHEHGYLFTYQKSRAYTCAIIGKPTEPVSIGYHATRTCFVQQILEQGLLKGTLERCNTERSDTVGSVYVSSLLDNARWWQNNYSKEFGEEFSILKIDLCDFQRDLYLDPFSSTGFAIKANVDPAYITLVQNQHPLPRM